MSRLLQLNTELDAITRNIAMEGKSVVMFLMEYKGQFTENEAAAKATIDSLLDTIPDGLPDPKPILFDEGLTPDEMFINMVGAWRDSSAERMSAMTTTYDALLKESNAVRAFTSEEIVVLKERTMYVEAKHAINNEGNEMKNDNETNGTAETVEAPTEEVVESKEDNGADEALNVGGKTPYMRSTADLDIGAMGYDHMSGPDGAPLFGSFATTPGQEASSTPVSTGGGGGSNSSFTTSNIVTGVIAVGVVAAVGYGLWKMFGDGDDSIVSDDNICSSSVDAFDW